MNCRIHLGFPSILQFKGPDAVRFLNGQVTQDVRKLAGGKIALPSCVTDAKGKLQFRVFLTEESPDSLLVIGGPDQAEVLEGRLTRYLIADEVEVTDLTGQYRLIHFTGSAPIAPDAVLVRESNRYHVPGTDWLVPAGLEIPLEEIPVLEGDALEAFRILQGVPEWGKELLEGILPPEAGLDETDISYHKGCYIGQEVISRIKSAGKVNRKLTRLQVPAMVEGRELVNAEGGAAGELTSVSPETVDGFRPALGYVKRSSLGQPLRVKSPDGTVAEVISG